MTTIVAEHLTRQADLLPLRVLGLPITVIGAGAIGSFVTLGLAKMGFGNIMVYDFDTVDTVNLNSQFYRFKDVGQYKTYALKEIVKDFSNVDISFSNSAWKGQPLGAGGIIISAADSMAVRRMIWEANPMARAIIDSRMGAEYASLYTMKPHEKEDKEDYPATLYTDEEAVQVPCTAKATVYTATLLAGLVCKSVKDLALGNPYNRIVHWDIAKNSMLNWQAGIKEEVVMETQASL